MQDITTQLQNIIKDIDNELETISSTINRQITTKTYDTIELLELKKHILLDTIKNLSKYE